MRIVYEVQKKKKNVMLQKNETYDISLINMTWMFGVSVVYGFVKLVQMELCE